MAKLRTRILQIMPASGWHSVYGFDESEEGACTFPLVGWALVEDENGDRDVIGLEAMSGCVSFAQDSTRVALDGYAADDTAFNEYMPPGANPEEYLERARAAAKRREERKLKLVPDGGKTA